MLSAVVGVVSWLAIARCYISDGLRCWLLHCLVYFVTHTWFSGVVDEGDDEDE